MSTSARNDKYCILKNALGYNAYHRSLCRIYFFEPCSRGTVIHLEKGCSEFCDSHSQQIQECESQTHEHESRTLADK